MGGGTVLNPHLCHTTKILVGRHYVIYAAPKRDIHWSYLLHTPPWAVLTSEAEKYYYLMRKYVPSTDYAHGRV